MSDFQKAALAGLIRQAFFVFSGWLAARGVTVDNSTVEAIVGVALAIATAIHSFRSKAKVHGALAEAKAETAQATAAFVDAKMETVIAKDKLENQGIK